MINWLIAFCSPGDGSWGEESERGGREVPEGEGGEWEEEEGGRGEEGSRSPGET